MKTVWIAVGHWLSEPAAMSYERMRVLGCPSGGLNDAGRTRAEQEEQFFGNYQRGASGSRWPRDRRVYQGVAYYRRKGGVSVAIPGSPQARHEKGLSLDVSTSSAAHRWMVRHENDHGWFRVVKGEAWHREYNASRDKYLHSGIHLGPFADVPAMHQFAKAIAWMKGAGITNGWSDGTFRPGERVSREAVAAFLYRLAGRPAVNLPKRSPFKDVPKDSQFFREIVWLDQQRITTGYEDGTFRPKDPIARDAMAAFLYRAAGRPRFTAPKQPRFKDVPRSAQFYREIEWLAAQRITTGYADGTFRPYESITREATAAFLYRSH